MKRYLLFLALILWVVAGMSQVPAPSAFYTFDQGSGINFADSSGNDYSGRWYNIFGEDPGSPVTSTSGWRPTEGYRNGAAYLSGDHSVCPEDCPDPGGGDCTCSSGTDLLVFSEDADGSCDDGFIGTSANAFYHGSFSQFTLAFWYKNDWDYLCPAGSPRRTCFKESGACAWERQVLFSMGDEDAGITLAIEPGATIPSLLRASIAGDNSSTQVQVLGADSAIDWNPDWLHIAVVFEGDGASSGTFTLYFNGDSVQQRPTDFGKMTINANSAVFGGEHDKSVTGFNVTSCWGNTDFLLCGITAQFYNTLRYGWPARGWLDELAVWGNVALSGSELKDFARIGDTTASVNVQESIRLSFRVQPSPTEGVVSVMGLPSGESFEVSLTNAMGQVLFRKEGIRDQNRIQLPEHLPNGIYQLQVSDKNSRIGVGKFVLQR